MKNILKVFYELYTSVNGVLDSVLA
jgi:hypothetical protein